MKKKLNKNKSFYFSIIILGLIFIAGAYLAYLKSQDKSRKVVTIPKTILREVDENLTKKDWVWLSMTLENSQVIKPRSGEFILKFTSDGSFTSSTDCNSISGKFNSLNGIIQFENNIVTTEKYCMKSLEGPYVKQLQNAKNYKFNEKNQLIIELKDGSGFMIFN
jgi:heat shock protein HslJ